MSVLLAFLTAGLMILYVSLLKRLTQPAEHPAEKKCSASLAGYLGKLGMEVPPGYYFHPCHMWALNEGSEVIRVGLDSFATNLFGEFDHIDVPRTNRWVRQGQKLMTVTAAGVSIDVPSPVEGIVREVNQAAVDNPELVRTQPFGEGWIAAIESPFFISDKKNLIPDSLVRSWIHCSILRLRELTTESPVFAQDGGWPVTGVLNRVPPDVRDKIVKELFLTSPKLIHSELAA